MNKLNVALHTEALKAGKSGIFKGTIIFFAFIGIMMGLLVYAAGHPEITSRSSTLATKVSFIEGADWYSLFGLLLQIILTLGTLGFGLITSWIFGREFSDRTLKDILVLPVSRALIVSAKFLVSLIWGFILSLVILVMAILTGIITDLAGWDSEAFTNFLKLFFLSSFLTLLLSTIIGFIASAGKGYIAPIAFVVIFLIITQFNFVGAPDYSVFNPWAYPALVSGVAGNAAPSPNLLALLVYLSAISAGYFVTLFWWKNADHT